MGIPPSRFRKLVATFVLVVANGATGCAAPRFAQPDPAFRRDIARCEREETCPFLWEQAVSREKACLASGGDERACAAAAHDHEIVAEKMTPHLIASGARAEANAKARQAREARERNTAAIIRMEHEAQRLREQALAMQAREEEALDWQKVDLFACADMPSTESCEPLFAYVKKYEQRGSVHLEEANRSITQVRAPLLAALDAKMWEAARATECVGARVPEACDGVVAYLKAFPAGARAGDARRVLEAGAAGLAGRGRGDEAGMRAGAAGE